MPGCHYPYLLYRLLCVIESSLNKCDAGPRLSITSLFQNFKTRNLPCGQTVATTFQCLRYVPKEGSVPVKTASELNTNFSILF